MTSAAFDLQSLFSAAEPVGRSIPRRAGAGDGVPSTRLRRDLAVRGWVAPTSLLPKDADAEVTRAVLGQLACDVETAVLVRPGQWYLSVAARRDEIASCTDAELQAACRVRFPEDQGDPVRRAFELALAPRPPALGDVAADVLPALANVSDWLGERWRAPWEAREIAAELAVRTLDADLVRMTRLPLVGHVHHRALQRLVEFASQPGPDGLRAIYVHGGGGAGKTTLLAFLQRELRTQPLPPTFARIDFDEPAINPAKNVTLTIALLEQVAATVPRAARALPALRELSALQGRSGVGRGSARRSGKQARSTKGALQSESVTSEAASDESSMLYGLLAPPGVPGPLVIVMDTAEVVLGQGDRVAASLADWLRFLRTEAGARDVRLVVAGRDPPTGQAESRWGFATNPLLARLADAGARLDESLALPDLANDEAAELLRNCGIEDERLIAQAVDAVPANPLLLRITADALRHQDETMRQAVQQAHRDSRVDPASARNYLMRRIVAHVSDPAARPYVLAACHSPLLTRAMLEEVVIPSMDRALSPARGRGMSREAAPAGKVAPLVRDLAQRVFRSIAATSWLVRPTLDADAIPFNRDIRALALRLLAADDGDVALARDLRQGLAIHHLRRRSPLDRALALYHLALLGLPYALPRDRAAIRDGLVDVLSELPESLRQWLDEEPVLRAPARTSARRLDRPIAEGMSDGEWKTYLEGDRVRDGEGAQMVKDDRAREALALYVSRPTRPQAAPPTFVVQALADLGEWQGGLVDIAQILETESGEWFRARALSPEAMSRIYWITRLALLANEGRLTPAHLELLTHVASVAKGPGLTTLPALIAVAEAREDRSIMGAQMRLNALKTEAAGRILLTTGFWTNPIKTKLQEGHLAVTQKDWCERVSRLKDSVWSTDAVGRLERVQARLDRLHGRPIAMVNQLFGKLEERMTILPVTLKPDQSVLLFRGMTVEFHRPLREALLSMCPDGAATPLFRAIVGPTLEQMSIRPVELHPDEFYRRLASNPRVWCAAFVGYADRCRLLPSFCRRLQRLAMDPLPERVAASFLAWDRALCRDVESDWRSL